MAATLLRASSTRSSTSPILTSTQAASMPTMPSGLMGACPASSRSAILLVPAPITGSAEAAGCPDRRPLPSRGCIVGPLPAAGEQGGKPASLAVGEGRPLVDEVAHVPLGRIGLQLAPLVDGDIGLVGCRLVRPAARARRRRPSMERGTGTLPRSELRGSGLGLLAPSGGASSTRKP